MPIFGYHNQNGEPNDRSAPLNGNDSHSDTSTKVAQRSSKKPAPTPPSNGNANYSPRASVERRGSLNSSPNNDRVATLPRNFLTKTAQHLAKPERPSLRHALNSSVDTSSSEAVDSVGEKSPNLSYATGSLDRKCLSNKTDDLNDRKAGDRKTVVFNRNFRSTDKSSASQPSVARDRPYSFIERPSIPPPERPIRNIDQMKRQQSLENLTEDVVSPSRAYPDLTMLSKSLSSPSAEHMSKDAEHKVATSIQDAAEPTTNGGHAGHGHDDEVTIKGLVEEKNIVSSNNGHGDEIARFVDDSEDDVLEVKDPSKDDVFNADDESSSPEPSNVELSSPEPPPEKPPRLSPVLRNTINHQKHFQEKLPLTDANANTYNRKSADADLVPEGKVRPPRPVPPATKPRFASLTEASHL